MYFVLAHVGQTQVIAKMFTHIYRKKTQKQQQKYPIFIISLGKFDKKIKTLNFILQLKSIDIHFRHIIPTFYHTYNI